ncbi:hypothetical protein CVV68_16795 [Arthrobacter livingstonensis]|uniref:DUF3311 domain-containing protein n=1 Tax=Arthrobacter livingstonensis TaxID=670078 RepID=A0A2V5LUR4_9MICC|nr:DUF3311 domain-containing protein [Arthrobacter livingstonensis]PYI65706.1 hypothetical protein CVV68_16795 [Arthrobacter livingstonensis]
MIPRTASVVIALITPVTLVTLGVLLLGGSTATIFGIPLILLFMFVMFPVTSLLMWISWRLFDKDGDYQLDELEGATTEVAP